MTVLKRLAILATVAVLGAILIYSWRRMAQPKVLRVGFPLAFIRQDQKILDPDNTDTVYQYYLLENLAVGLVRDSSQSPSGYEPCLAESWERPSPNRWIFRLKPALAWSDGTPIKPSDIAAHIESLSHRPHRHILYLKKLVRATVEGDALILDFSSPVNDGLIHELSLADAALLRSDTISGGWRAVSGPYSVESYEPGKRLLLLKNPHYQGPAGYPERVELVNFTMDTIGSFFDTVDIDLLKVPAPVFRAANQKVLAHAPQVIKGYPTWMYYFYFNPKKPLWRDAQARKDFGLIVEQALAGFKMPNFSPERQLIPEGYSGHLDSAPKLQGSPDGRLTGRRFKVNLLPSFTEAPQFTDAMRDGFAKAKVSLDFGSAWDFEPGDEADVQMTQFAGNQRDAMGSWQFMFSPDHGDLAAFRAEAEPFFARIIAADGKEGREAVLRDLHDHVLRGVYAVPLFIEADVLAASKRVDLSRLNPFDMRLRFYDVQWK